MKISKLKNAPQVALIEQLNPIIRGWFNYYSSVCSTETFAKMKDIMYHKLMHWAKSRHPNEYSKWIVRKYWRPEQGKWDFAIKNGIRLKVHTEIPIKRHVKVRVTKSPFDGGLIKLICGSGIIFFFTQRKFNDLGVATLGRR